MPSFHATGLVLKHTKLGETDLIIQFICNNGIGLKAVAKGARKPGSKLSGKCELFSEVDLLCSKGRSLDIIQEVSILHSAKKNRDTLEHIIFSTPLLDILEKIVRDGEADTKLYPLTKVALSYISETNDCSKMALYLSAALLKIMSLQGYRPLLCSCILCGSDLKNPTRFSLGQGGCLCDTCSGVDYKNYPPSLLAWIRFLIGSTFADIKKEEHKLTNKKILDILWFVREWYSTQLCFRLKSLEFIFNSGLVEF